MRKENIKKLLPAVSIFAFVAFAFTIAYAFGDTYAAFECDSNYTFSNGKCCPTADGARYDSTTNQCIASYNSGCPDDYSEGYSNPGTCVATAIEPGVVSDTPSYYTIRFNTNGSDETIDSISVVPNETYILPAITAREGYTFLGWKHGDALYSSGQSMIATGNRNYVAEWQVNEYTVRFDANGGGWYENGGTTSVKSETVTYGELIELPSTPVRSEYRFLGWKYSDVLYSSGQELYVYANRTYVAEWELNSTDTDPEDPGDNEENPDGGDNSQGGTPGGGDSSGENNSGNSGNSGTTGGDSTGDTDTEDDTTNATKYTVKFNLNDGTFYVNNKETSTTSYSLSELDYSLYTAKKSGYMFYGWSTKANSCNSTIAKGKKDLNSDTELYACYLSNDELNNAIGKETSKEEINKNPKTGGTLLYIVFLVGILALGYTVYYSYKVVKSKH